jgi:predicted aspartyl protease
MRPTIIIFSILFLMADACNALAADHEESSEPTISRTVEARPADMDSVEFIYYQRCIFVKMLANSREELLFLLDTGASRSAIDRTAAERSGIPISGTDSVEGTAGIITVQKGHVDRLSRGEAGATGLDVTIQDLGGTLAPPGMRVDGILGYDFLRSFSVAIDFTHHTLRFSPHPARVSFAMAKSADVVPVVLDNGIPRVHGMLDDSIPLDLRLDTGASIFETTDIYLNVTEDTWKQLTRLDSALKPERYFTGSGAGGEIKLAVARIDKLRIGAISVPRPYVIVQPSVGYFARPDAVGFISNNLLEKYSPVVIDYLEGRLYLSRR